MSFYIQLSCKKSAVSFLKVQRSLRHMSSRTSSVLAQIIGQCWKFHCDGKAQISEFVAVEVLTLVSHIATSFSHIAYTSAAVSSWNTLQSIIARFLSWGKAFTWPYNLKPIFKIKFSNIKWLFIYLISRTPNKIPFMKYGWGHLVA